MSGKDSLISTYGRAQAEADDETLPVEQREAARQAADALATRISASDKKQHPDPP